MTDASPDWDAESPRPNLGNLATHLKKAHSKLLGEELPETGSEAGSASAHGLQHSNNKSAELLEGFLKRGAMNPAVEPTLKGFYRVFAAWILEDDLPFTTGESPSLARLFKYLKIKYQLPSDTTVRNQLTKIFAILHEKIVEELTVCSYINYILV